MSPQILQRPNSASPRPSSAGSGQSYQSSRGPRLNQDVCIGEEVRIAIHLAIEKFRTNEGQKEFEFPTSLTATERAYIHRYCDSLGIKHKSKGKGSNRILTITKREGNQTVTAASTLQLVRNSRQQISNLLQRFPLTSKERQELLPRSDKNQAVDAGKELSKTAIGRLNNGVAQVPPRRSGTELDSFRESLPIVKYKEEIMNIVNNNRVVLLSGETGSGKTTQVPQMILDDCSVNNKPCRIFCTQPRRIAALSIAERVATERGEKIGQTVGYQIRLESKVSPKTLLTFCTNGVLLRTLMSGNSCLTTATHIIVDEVHERDRFSDFLLTAIQNVLPKYGNLKIILMSAALNVDLFVKYFNNCPVISIPGSLFSVQEYFLEDILKWTKFSNKKMEKMNREKEKLEKQQQKLIDWCSKMALDDATSHQSHYIEDIVAAEIAEDKGTEKAKEKEDLESWVIQEMDNFISDIWLTGNEDSFSQLFHLIVTENVSVDYKHSDTGLTALMIASARGFVSIAEQLLNLGANVNVRSSNDWTAIDWGRKFKQEEVVEMLEAYSSESEVVTNESDIQDDKQLSEEDRELLSLYQHSFDDDKVDLDLILSLLHKILTTSQEGAMLIFLPGYDDIVALREMITEDKFFERYRYLLYTLHSAMQSGDQKRVFRTPPPGVRKIILATNIAETSITINDVVFVIDAGKVKEKTYDALLSVTMLKSIWISKASALQRKGRAGRCRQGVCYHLFSRVRHSAMLDYATPEILRYPLQEICLHTKLLAPSNCPIAEFLSKAPEPPAYLLTRNAVQFLKQIDALDDFEDLTELGHHLADMPVDPRLGKMVLYSVVLKCVDPILTIVCALGYKDPFLLPTLPYQKRSADAARQKFSANTLSDHMSLLRAFQAWQKARTDGWEKSFCENNYLSAACMEMIVGMRTQLLGQLRASGFVRARGGGDIRDLNTNSENWAAVKAALCAGIYPHVLRVDRNKARNSIVSQKEPNVKFHKTSVFKMSGMSDRVVINNIPSDWIVYEEMSKHQRFAQVRCCTAVSPIALAIFAGPCKLARANIKERELDTDPMRDDLDNISSDSEDEDKEDSKKTTLQLDDWLSFKMDTETANLVLQLRQKWNSLFLRRMKAPSKPWSQVDEAVIKAIISVLTNEEQSLGFQQPAGIGQRPRPMTTESIMSTGNGHGNYDYDDLHDNRLGKGRKVVMTPPRKNNQLTPRTPGTPGDDKSDTSSNSNSASAANSLKGSASSTPCASPQPNSPSKILERDLGGYSGRAVRYFVVKCINQKHMEMSLNKGIWATSPSNERKINRAYLESRAVYLVFSIQGSGHFQGYARVTSALGKEKIQEFSISHTGTFNVEWIKRGNISFQNTQHLRNMMHEKKKIQLSRDGQEMDQRCGELLLKLWDKFPDFQSKSSPSSASSAKSLKDENTLVSSTQLPSTSPAKDDATSSSKSKSDDTSSAKTSSSSEVAQAEVAGTAKKSPGGSDSGSHNVSGHQGNTGYNNRPGSGHYQGHGGHHQNQGYDQGHRPGSYPYQQGQGHQYYYQNQHRGGGHHGHSRSYDMGYHQYMAPGFNPMYMGPMNSPPRHGMSPVMILQRGQSSGGHIRQYHHGYGSGGHYQDHGNR